MSDDSTASDKAPEADGAAKEAPVAAAEASAEPGASAAADAPVHLVLENVVQEYPKPEGGVVRVVDGIDLTFDGPGINMSCLRTRPTPSARASPAAADSRDRSRLSTTGRSSPRSLSRCSVSWRLASR